MSALFGDSPLAMTNADVARLTRPQREARVDQLIKDSYSILAEAVTQHAADHSIAGIVILFSGGNDSTVLAHLFRSVATHAAHANTTIGIEQTRDFVRNTCEEWGLPLLERLPPNEEDYYRSIVLRYGFPGPAMHYKMFQRLKERALRQVRRELVSAPRKQRVVFLGGIRRAESVRRANRQEMHREGSVVWVSPLINWTKLDLTTYRLMRGDVPVNEVGDLIHMSGECLCGSFAAPGERAELSYWFPDVAAEIAALEAEIADREDIPEYRKTWGWGADPDVLATSHEKPSRTGALCSSCDDRFQPALFEGVAS